MKRILSVLGLSAITVFFVLTGPAGAKSTLSPLEISLQAAISQALEKNPHLLAAGARLDASSHRITQAGAGMLPQAYFTQSYQRTTNPMWVLGGKLNQENILQQDFSPDVLNNPDALDNFTSRVWVNWPLFDSGQSWFSRQQAVTDQKANEAAFERSRQETIFHTVEAYSDLLLARQSIGVVEQALKTAGTHLKMIEDRFNNGLAVKSDVLRAKVHIAELEQDHIMATSRVAISRAALNVVMGNETELKIVPADKLERTKTAPSTLPEWIGKALTNRPDLMQLSLQEQMAKTEIRKGRAGHLPSIDLNGSYELNSEDFDDTAKNYTVGVSATISLFSGLRISSMTREAMSRYQEIIAIRQAMVQNVRLETEKAYYDLISADSRITSASLAVEMSEEALRIIKDRYESGLVSIDSLLDAELSLYRAGNSFCHALRDHLQARGRLDMAAGVLMQNFH